MGTKSSPDDDQEMLQLSEAIIRRVKWSYKSLLERCGLKMLRFFEKFGKPPFPDLLPVNRCVNDVKRVWSRPNSGGVAADFHDAPLENQTSDRLRIGGNLLVTNSSIDCESFISGLSSPLTGIAMRFRYARAEYAYDLIVKDPDNLPLPFLKIFLHRHRRIYRHLCTCSIFLNNKKPTVHFRMLEHQGFRAFSVKYSE